MTLFNYIIKKCVFNLKQYEPFQKRFINLKAFNAYIDIYQYSYHINGKLNSKQIAIIYFCEISTALVCICM